LNLPYTPVEILHKARKIGLEEGLRYVYEGNVPGELGENTYCHKCGKLLIRRHGYQILENRTDKARCPDCSAEIDGVGL
jgi:pyruvate formate lyase activating enzyme